MRVISQHPVGSDCTSHQHAWLQLIAVEISQEQGLKAKELGRYKHSLKQKLKLLQSAEKQAVTCVEQSAFVEPQEGLSLKGPNPLTPPWAGMPPN